jgi:hypothetical protein
MTPASSETVRTPASCPISSAARLIGVSASRVRKPDSTSRARSVPALSIEKMAPCMKANAIAKST